MGRLRFLLVVLAAAGLAACGEKSAPKPAPKGVALAAATVELRDVELTTSAEAVMEAVRQSTVSAQIAGRIVDLRFDVGDYVKKGDVILRIDERSAARALEASEAQVLEAQAALANARANYERSKQLLAQKFISQAALDQAEAAYKSAQARVGALVAGAGAAATERSFATVVAPYSGVVSARHIELGEMATPGKPLMTGFDPSTLRVVATVPQAQVAAIQAGGKARIEVPSLGRWIDVKADDHRARGRSAHAHHAHPARAARGRARRLSRASTRARISSSAGAAAARAARRGGAQERGHRGLRRGRAGPCAPAPDSPGQRGRRNVGRGARRPEAGRARRARARQGGNGRGPGA